MLWYLSNQSAILAKIFLMGTEGRYFGPISRIDAAPLFPLLPLVNWITPEAERTLLRLGVSKSVMESGQKMPATERTSR